jgi:hypothetical protein
LMMTKNFDNDSEFGKVKIFEQVERKEIKGQARLF